jgi:outer membrane protein assembly factor BamE (lipoprotein component of BamABCDE complex)
MRKVFFAVLVLSLSACSIVYRLPTRQGNVIDQAQLDKLAVGQTRDQVKFLLGTPVASSPFRSDRWDYLGYYKDPRGKVSSRTISLYFDGDRMARMEGVQIAGREKPLDSPDIERIKKEQQKDENDKSRSDSEKGHESGVTIQQPKS